MQQRASKTSAIYLFEGLAAVDSDNLRDWQRYLCPEDQAYAQGLSSKSRFRQFIAGRSLLRYALQHRGFHTAADSLEIHTHNGRPSLKGHQVSFSISHTGSIVAVALHSCATLGLDVERWRVRRFMEIAEACFSTEQIQILKALSLEKTLPSDLLRRQFYHFWTLKEASAKYSGRGFRQLLERQNFNTEIGLGEKVANALVFDVNNDEIESYSVAMVGDVCELPKIHLVENDCCSAGLVFNSQELEKLDFNYYSFD